MVAGLVAEGVTPAAAAAPALWSQVTGAGGPSNLAGAPMAYDPATGQTIMFGGTANGTTTGPQAGTWDWNGSTWAALNPPSSPTARYGASLAYDTTTSQLLLFGGYNGTIYMSDTWSWTGSTWEQLSPTTSPTARSGASLAFDGLSGQMVLFGGRTGASTEVSDTWTWSGSNWTLLSPSTSPTSRYDAAFAYDPAISQMVLFGGNNGTAPLGDTYVWNGSTWASELPATSPSARYGETLAYSSALGEPVLFGGETAAAPDSSTWGWTGSTWAQLSSSTSPTARTMPAMAFDQSSGQMVVFGGFDGTNYLGDTWQWSATAVTAISPSAGPLAGGTSVTITGLGFNGVAGRRRQVRQQQRHVVQREQLHPDHGSGAGKLRPGRRHHRDQRRGHEHDFGGRRVHLRGRPRRHRLEPDVGRPGRRGPRHDHRHQLQRRHRCRFRHASADHLHGGQRHPDHHHVPGRAGRHLRRRHGDDAEREERHLGGGPVHLQPRARGHRPQPEQRQRGRRDTGDHHRERADGGHHGHVRHHVGLQLHRQLLHLHRRQFAGPGGGRGGGHGDRARRHQRHLSGRPVHLRAGAERDRGDPRHVVAGRRHPRQHHRHQLHRGPSSGVAGVMFGTTAATSFTVNSATSITATAPAETAATVDITVTTPAGTSSTSSADQFSYYSVPSWSQAQPATSPPAIGVGGAEAYDPATGQTILFYGTTTWAWNGTTWSELSTTAPADVAYASMAYDTSTSQLVLFGGWSYSNGTYYGGTWTWNSTTSSWTTVATSGPAVREQLSMAYDPATSQLLVFGGIGTSNGVYADTWKWTGTAWSQVASTGPSARWGASMAFDPAMGTNGALVLYGGNSSGNYYGDTWTWSGMAWAQLSTTANPPPRYGADMAYDAATSQLLFFGGVIGSTIYGDTWDWTGTTWVQLLPAAAPGASLLLLDDL